MPVQARSERTFDAVLEAAARILERSGYEGFNTNSIAEVAGVSPGSVYQFFPDKNAIVRSLVIREVSETARRVVEAMKFAEEGGMLSLAIDVALAHVQERAGLTTQLALAEPFILMEPHEQELASSVNAALATAIVRDRGVSKDVAIELAFDVLGIMKGLLLSAVARGEVGDVGLAHKVNLAASSYVSASVSVKSAIDG